MHLFFTQRGSAFAAHLFLSLLTFCSFNAYSQCETFTNSYAPAVTEPFNKDVFTTSAGVSYTSPGVYETTGNVATFSITSYKLQVVGNIIAVGLQITDGASKISSGTIEVIENGQVTCSYRGAINTNNYLTARISGLNGKVVQFRFTFARSNNGRVQMDNFGIDPAMAVLPVKFTHFSAAQVNNGTQLTWHIAEETNVKGYDIESSTNGVQFHKIGFATATDINTYTFTDVQPAPGLLYYRIKNLDHDGKYSYSNIVTVSKSTVTSVLKAFPTPAKSNITVKHSAAQNATLTISTQEGKVAKVVKPANGTLQTVIDFSGMAPGLYLAKWADVSGTAYIKLVKQ